MTAKNLPSRQELDAEVQALQKRIGQLLPDVLEARNEVDSLSRKVDFQVRRETDWRLRERTPQQIANAHLCPPENDD